MTAEIALASCSIHRPAPGVEVVVAGAGVRSFPTRVSDGLGVCLKAGATHAVTVEGRRLRYPADSVSVRTPGCVWASEPGLHGFVSIDVAPDLLPGDREGAPVSFVGADRLPGVAAAAQRLIAVDDPLEADDVVTGLMDAVVASGAIVSDVVRAGGDREATVARACEYLRTNADRRPRLDEVATALGVSKYALLRRFRRALGTTPHAYLVMVRVNRAQALLARGATPAEAAAGAGFSDQAHMGTWFRRLLGVTPAAYRREALCAISLQTPPVAV